MQYSVERQLTVALENRPGQLAATCAAIAAEAVSIEAISVLDTVEQSVVRLIASDPERCKEILVRQGFYVIEADVLAVRVNDSTGKLALLCQALADAQINIAYAYGSVPRTGELTRLMVKVSNLARACLVLNDLKEG